MKRVRAPAAALFILLCSAASAMACGLGNAPDARWRTEKIQGEAWLVSPCDTQLFSIGVNVLDSGNSGAKLDRPHYDWRRYNSSLDEWIGETRARMAQWAFNSAGSWSLPPQQLRLPGVIDLELGRNAKFHWFDPFDPAMGRIMDDKARELTAPYRASPYRIGYFSDNEVGWWDGALFTFYSRKPAENFTKRRLVTALRGYYHEDWRRFAEDFVPPAEVHSWRELLASQVTAKLRPGGAGAKFIALWTHIVAEHYYALAAHAIHQADPGALYFGDRLPIYYDPAAISAEAPYVDAIASNYNLDSPEGWVAPYYFDGLRDLTGGKPVLISEWFYAAHQNRTGNRNNGHLMTVDTQAERASGAAAAAKNFAAIPEVLGVHWFQYYDYPVGGRQDSEDYNFGLVDIENRPYEELTASLGLANRALPAIHREARTMPRQDRARIVIPKAEIDPAHASLIDWPKSQSLLPPLRTAKGDVAFGEAYLAWSDQGISLATIGQDYYDTEVLAYDGAFPLSEAYRIELDMDAGAGPKRFTLYFIPPKGKTRDFPPMAPMLCAGAPAEHHGTSCPSVPGATTLYFGADQPRIVAETLIPWQALGLAGPPDKRRIKFEVSARSWFRARWMSLSGLNPEKSSAIPAAWTAATLGRDATPTQ
jgi:hypothetical protein